MYGVHVHDVRYLVHQQDPQVVVIVVQDAQIGGRAGQNVHLVVGQHAGRSVGRVGVVGYDQLDTAGGRVLKRAGHPREGFFGKRGHPGGQFVGARVEVDCEVGGLDGFPSQRRIVSRGRPAQQAGKQTSYSGCSAHARCDQRFLRLRFLRA